MPEQPVWTGSPSQVRNAWAFLLAAIVALAILFGTLVYKYWPPGIAFVLVPIFYGVVRWLSVRARRYELTTERLLTSTGILTRTTDSLELYRVKDLQVIQPIRERIFGLENIALMTSDQTTPVIVLDHVPSHLRLADKIREYVEACRTSKGTREVEVE